MFYLQSLFVILSGRQPHSLVLQRLVDPPGHLLLLVGELENFVVQKLRICVRKNAQEMTELSFDFVLDVMIVGLWVVDGHGVRRVDVDERRRWKTRIEAEDRIGRRSLLGGPVVRHSTVATQVVADKSETQMDVC